MKITQDEKRMLKSFRGNIAFLNYLDKIMDEVCDIRNGNHSTEVRKKVADVIQKNLVDPIRFDNNSKENNPRDMFLGNIGE